MVDPLSLNPARPSSPSRQKTGNAGKQKDLQSSQAPASADSVRLESLSLRATLKEQAGILKQELPGIIADAIQAPVERDAVRGAPAAATRFRLEKPLRSILDRNTPLPPSLVEGLQSEIQSLQKELPELRDHAALAPFDSDPEKEEALNGFLFDVSDQMERLVDHLRRLV